MCTSSSFRLSKYKKCISNIANYLFELAQENTPYEYESLLCVIKLRMYPFDVRRLAAHISLKIKTSSAVQKLSNTFWKNIKLYKTLMLISLLKNSPFSFEGQDSNS